jgi:hypothetical protein
MLWVIGKSATIRGRDHALNDAAVRWQGFAMLQHGSKE